MRPAAPYGVEKYVNVMLQVRPSGKKKCNMHLDILQPREPRRGGTQQRTPRFPPETGVTNLVGSQFAEWAFKTPAERVAPTPRAAPAPLAPRDPRL